MPGVVGSGIGLYVAQYDDLALTALVNSHAFHRPQAGNAKSALLCCLYRNRVQVFGERLQGYLEQERLLCHDHRALPGLLSKAEHREHLWTERDFPQLEATVSRAVGHFVERLYGDGGPFYRCVVFHLGYFSPKDACLGPQFPGIGDEYPRESSQNHEAM